LNSISPKRFAPITILLIIVGILLVAGGGYYAVKKFQKPEVQVCTQEAKQCPDGSYVGRTGPKCEFAVCPGAKADETANWKTYRNETYGFEFNYPTYLTLKKESTDTVSLIRGSLLEYHSFEFSPDPTNAFWGAFLVYDINNFWVYSDAEYSWVFYDLLASKWYVSGEANIGAHNLPRIKEKEYQPFPDSKTLSGVPIYSGFGYKDVGLSESHKLIISPNSKIILDFYNGSDSNDLDFRSKEAQRLSQKFTHDLEFIIQSTTFFAQ
jgi:hypothetical protein